jgi:hypothetical protein
MSTELEENVNDARTNAFIELFDFAEANNINLDGEEWKSLSLFATSETGINQKVSDLGNLDVASMSEYEFKRILKRARTGVKQIVEQRSKFAPIVKEVNGERLEVGKAGPFRTNRRMRRGIIKSGRASQRSSRASEIVKQIKERRIVIE